MVKYYHLHRVFMVVMMITRRWSRVRIGDTSSTKYNNKSVLVDLRNVPSRKVLNSVLVKNVQLLYLTSYHIKFYCVIESQDYSP